MQEQLNKIREHINRISNSYKQTEECAFLIRSALALSIHVFYYKKYGMSVNIPSSLNDAIKDSRFRSAFYNEMMILSDIQSIRITCNTIIHPTDFVAKYREDDMMELHKRLLKCIKAIEEKADIKIIKSVSNQVFSKNIFSQVIITDNDEDNKKAIKVFKDAKFEGEIFNCKGIQDVVGKYFDQPENITKSIMRSRWIIPYFEKEIVWVVKMVRTIPDKPSNKWVNVYLGNEIIEIPPEGTNTFGKQHIRDYAKKHPYRIAVEKTSDVVVHGVYKFDENKSINDLKHYYTKI